LSIFFNFLYYLFFFTFLRNAEREITSRIASGEFSELEMFWKFWYPRRGVVQEITRRPGAPTTSNLSESQNAVDHANGSFQTLEQAVISDLGESLLLEAKIRSMEKSKFLFIFNLSIL
jgi:hypothetical protein